MFMATCIGCGRPYQGEMPDKTPAYRVFRCDKCGQLSIDVYSRFNPRSYGLFQFVEEHFEKDPDLVKQILTYIGDDRIWKRSLDRRSQRGYLPSSAGKEET